jgi:hypothetical protein
MQLLCCNLIARKGNLERPEKTARGCAADSKEFLHTLAYLEKLCPPPMPVRLSFSYMHDTMLGQCQRKKKYFLIRLNKFMNQFQSADVLVHEWAHALAWNYALDRLVANPDTTPEEFETASHDEVWGCAYARTYRAHLAALSTFSASTEKHHGSR